MTAFIYIVIDYRTGSITTDNLIVIVCQNTGSEYSSFSNDGSGRYTPPPRLPALKYTPPITLSTCIYDKYLLQ